jgi:hypothetical protein
VTHPNHPGSRTEPQSEIPRERPDVEIVANQAVTSGASLCQGQAPKFLEPTPLTEPPRPEDVPLGVSMAPVPPLWPLALYFIIVIACTVIALNIWLS